VLSTSDHIKISEDILFDNFLMHISDGADERQITVEMCKVYLRENCLRLTGTKNILIERIKEHIQ
jgi:hypothetical protein